MSNIRFATEADVKIIKKIVDNSISVDYYSEQFIIDFIIHDGGYIYVYVDNMDKPLACLFFEKGGLKYICEKDNIPYPDESFESYFDNTEVIIYKTAATDPECRNNGILTEFLKEADIDTKNMDYDIKMCLCLILPNGKIPVKRHVETDGFVQIKRFKSPWNNIKSYCSYCNSEYCKCDGMLYIKEK